MYTYKVLVTAYVPEQGLRFDAVIVSAVRVGQNRNGVPIWEVVYTLPSDQAKR